MYKPDFGKVLWNWLYIDIYMVLLWKFYKKKMCNCPHNKKKNLIHLKVSADSATWSLEENNKLLTINYLLLNLNITATKYIIGDISGGLDKRPELHFFERYSNLVFKNI